MSGVATASRHARQASDARDRAGRWRAFGFMLLLRGRNVVAPLMALTSVGWLAGRVFGLRSERGFSFGGFDESGCVSHLG